MVSAPAMPCHATPQYSIAAAAALETKKTLLENDLVTTRGRFVGEQETEQLFSDPSIIWSEVGYHQLL